MESVRDYWRRRERAKANGVQIILRDRAEPIRGRVIDGERIEWDEPCPMPWLTVDDFTPKIR